MSKCPYCDKPISPNLQQCPHCGAPLKATSISTERSPQETFCPNCKSPVDKGDIICIYCGTNLLTGTKLEVQQTPKKRFSISLEWKKYLLLGGIVILFLIVLGASIVYLSYDPIKTAVNLSRTNILGAIDILQKYVQKNPKNIRACLILGKLYLQNDQYDEALEQFEKVTELDTKNPEAVWLLLYTSSMKFPNNTEMQMKYLKKVAELYPERNDIALLIALGENKMTRLEKNAELFENLKKLQIPIDGIISGYIITGLQKDAEDLIKNYSGAVSPVISSLITYANQGKEKEIEFLNSLDLSNLNLSAIEWGYLACKFLSIGDNIKALQCAQKSKNLSPKGLPAVDYLYALSLINSGTTTDALIELDRIRNTESPYSISATLDLAEIYLSQENLTKAEELIQSARNKGDQSPRSYLIEGRVALLNNDLGKAQQCFTTAIQKDPNYAPAYLENGLLYIRKGVLNEGLSNLKNYVKIVKATLPKYSVAEIEVLIEQIEQTLVNPNPAQHQSQEQV